MQQLLVQFGLEEPQVSVRLHQCLDSLLRRVENVLVRAVEGLCDLSAGAGIQVDLLGCLDRYVVGVDLGGFGGHLGCPGLLEVFHCQPELNVFLAEFPLEEGLEQRLAIFGSHEVVEALGPTLGLFRLGSDADLTLASSPQPT